METTFMNTENSEIRQQYKNNKLTIIAPQWNDEFELPDGYPLIFLFIFTSTGLIID